MDPGKAAASPVTSAILSSAVILAIGLFAYALLASLSNVQALLYLEEMNRKIEQQELALAPEYAYKVSENTLRVWVRNYGKTSAVIVGGYAYTLTDPHASLFSFYNVTVPSGGCAWVNLTCYGCEAGAQNGEMKVVVKIYAMPERLYDPEEPEAYVHYGRLFVSALKVPQP